MDFPAENSFEAVPLPGPSILSDQVQVQITQVYFLIATANGSAIAGARYLGTNGFLNFSDGQTVRTFGITLIDDNMSQGDQSVLLTLSNPGNGATLGLTNAALLIRDDEISNGKLSFSATNYTVVENAGSAAISVIRTNGSQGTVTANFTTADGTAKAGADYTITSGTMMGVGCATYSAVSGFPPPPMRAFSSRRAVTAVTAPAWSLVSR